MVTLSSLGIQPALGKFSVTKVLEAGPTRSWHEKQQHGVWCVWLRAARLTRTLTNSCFGLSSAVFAWVSCRLRVWFLKEALADT